MISRLLARLGVRSPLDAARPPAAGSGGAPVPPTPVVAGAFLGIRALHRTPLGCAAARMVASTPALAKASRTGKTRRRGSST